MGLLLAAGCNIKNKNKATLEQSATAQAEASTETATTADASVESSTASTETTTTETSSSPLPSTLKELGVTEDGTKFIAKSSLISYDVASPLWSDAAVKERYIKLPDGGSVSFVAESKTFSFPVGTLLVKHFAASDTAQTPMETRVMLLQADGSWAFATYQWQADGSTKRAAASEVVKIDANTLWPSGYRIPSEEECVKCHKSSPSEVNGFQPDQVYSGLAQLVQYKIISEATQKAIVDAGVSARPSPSDVSLSLKARGLAYLDINCGQCHRPEGSNSYLQLNSESINLEWMVKKSYFVAGDPDGSTVWKRFTAEKNRMPQVSVVQDPLGLKLLKLWILNWSKADTCVISDLDAALASQTDACVNQ